MWVSVKELNLRPQFRGGALKDISQIDEAGRGYLVLIKLIWGRGC